MSAKFLAGLRLGVLVLALVPTAAAAVAQEARPPDPPPERAIGTNGAAPGQPRSAPIGHRQPRAADVPADAPKDELAQRIEQINRSLDRQLQICRGC
jgi:hypothetical protein